MNTYKEMKEKHQKEVNEFPMFFAFSKKNFEEGMKKLGLNPTDTDKIYKFGNTGGFYCKKDAQKLHDMFAKQDKELKDAIASDDKFIEDMFNYELSNHEYVITCDFSDALSALGLTIEEVNKDERLKQALDRACKLQMENY